MQSQPNRQEPFSYNRTYPPTVPNAMTAGFTQSAIPYNDPQPITHGQTPVPIEPGPGRRNDDMYRGDMIPGYEFNYSMTRTGSWEPPAPQALGHSGYMMPSIQYNNVGQGGTNYESRYDFTANQFPDITTPFHISFPGHTLPRTTKGPFPYGVYTMFGLVMRCRMSFISP